MVLYVVDVNNHVPYLPPAQAQREGYAGMIAKATEGSSFVDPTFARYLADCHACGMPLMAYHFLHHDVPIADQVANIQRTVPTSITIGVDVEPEPSLNNYPTVGDAQALIVALTAVGYRVALTYLPPWYWQQLGSPSLAGLPPEWASRYVSGAGYASNLYNAVPPSWWQPVGGDPEALLQFTDQAVINGHNYDASAFNGTTDQLVALFDPIGGTPDMTPEQDNRLIWLETGVRTLINQLTGNAKGDPIFDGNMNPVTVPDWGWPSMIDSTKRFSVADFVRLIDQHTNQDNDVDNQILALVKTLSAPTVDVAALAAALQNTLAPDIVKALGQKLVA